MKKKFLVLCSILACTFTLSACNIQITKDSEKVKNEHVTKTIELKDEKKLNAKFDIGVCNLSLSGETDKLFDGSFDYNTKSLEPIFSYDNETINVSQEKTNFRISKNNTKCDYNLKINPKLPADINLKLGVGKSSLDFSKINLKNLEIESGVGETTIDLTGNYNGNIPVKIEGGVGKIKIIFSKTVGAKIKVEKGVGSVSASGFNKDGETYTNDSYGKAENSMDVNIETGVGEVNLELK